MRIPHIISEQYVKVYTPSPETLDLIGENQRLLVAENFEWNKHHVPSLADFCLQIICKNFEKYPEIIEELPCENRDHLFEILSTDLPLECAIVHINDDYYWKRRYADKFTTMKRRKIPQWTWKNYYLERHLRKILEEAQPQYDDEQFMDEILMLCAPYVKRLIVSQLQVWKPPLTMEKEEIPEEFPLKHINFNYIFCKIPFITEFDLIIGMKEVAEDFTWNMFNVEVMFFQRLGKALLDLKDLKILKIHRCKMEYPHCQALIQNIIKNSTLVQLDLSNCDLGDDGALCVAKFLMNHPKLNTLVLINDNIGQKGAEGLGFALLNMKQTNFCSMDLRLNPLRRDGTMGILRALMRSTSLKVLSLSGCLFEDDIPDRIGQVIKTVYSLKEFDISNNWFGEDGGEILVDAMKENTTIQVLDVRETDISSAQQEMIKQYLRRNKEQADVIQNDI